MFVFFVFLFGINAKSQTSDTTSLTDSELHFRDSILQLNSNNEVLKKSRDAYNSGLEFFQKKDFDAAITQFSEAVLIDSNFNLAYLSRAKCYEGINNKLAIADYLRVFNSDSLSFEPLYAVARLQSSFNKDTAIATYRGILDLKATEAKAFYEIGVLLFLKNQFEAAINEFNAALLINKDARIYNDRGSCYRMLEKYDKAIEDYLTAIALNHNLAFIYNNLASIYRKQENTDKALNYYNLAIERDANYAVSYNNKGSLLLELGSYPEAKLLIEQAIALDSEYAPAYNNRGVLLHESKKYAKAISDFDLAIKFDPLYGKAYLNRGISKQMIRDEDGACEDWSKAKELGINMVKKYIANDCE